MGSPASSVQPFPEPLGPRPLHAPGTGPSPEKQLASYQQLVETAHLLLVHGTLEEVLNRVADALGKLIPYDAATIYVADNERRLLQPTLARGAWADEVMRETTPFGEGVIGWVANHLEPAHVAHDDDDPRAAQVPGTPVEPESMIVIPLVARDTFRGVFAVYREGYVDFTHEEFTLAQVFADQAALAIDSAHAHDALEATARTDSLTGLYNHRFFHEHLRSELNRGHRYRYPVSLVVLDLDDFKGVNDRFGHLEGDAVLHRLGALLNDELRGNDHACRIGGEEFALILPHTDADGALELADRIRHVVRATSFGRAGSLSISAGVAAMPNDANDATALIEAADAALYASKLAGKDRVTIYQAGLAHEREGQVPRTDSRLGELAVLESLAHRVASLGDPQQIAELIALELRLAIDYHHCRVLLVDPSGEWLEPVAESGELFLEGRRRADLLRVAMGKGITGSAVATGRSLLVDDAASHPDALQLPGTAEIAESLLAVPMRYDQRSVGAIVLSKLGLGQFTPADRRLVEILASHAAVAFENAALNTARRRTAERADALLKLVTDAAGRGSLRRRLALLRRALPAEWVVMLAARDDGSLMAVEASGSRPSSTRLLRSLELELRADVSRLTRLTSGETAGLPASIRRERVLRYALDETTILLASASSAEGEREMRTTFRELGERLPPLLGSASSPLPAAVASAPRPAPTRRRMGRIPAQLPSGLPRRRLLAMLAEHAVRMTGADGASICDLDERTNTIRFLYPAGAPMGGSDQVTFQAHETIAGQAIRDAHALVVDDYRRHPKAHPIFLDLGLRSLAVVPISVNGRTVAGIDVYTLNRPMRFGASQIAVLEVIAQQAGALISQDKLYDELESSYRATVEALTNALEVKDAYTSEHVREIAELALELGRAFRLGTRRLRDLEYAAILHDIGKIGVPTAILTKPGPLTAEERTIVERHTEIGHGMLKDIPFLARAAEIVRSAHERWDGDGYPDGLEGDRIPLEARIIFVCDAWHAMRSDRSYRAALSAGEARRRLATGAGTQFDPRVVDVFLKSDAAR